MSDKRFLKTALKSGWDEQKLRTAKEAIKIARAQGARWTALPSQHDIKERNEYEFARRERALKAAVKAHRKQNDRIGPHVSVLDIAQWLLDDQEPWKINGDKV